MADSTSSARGTGKNPGAGMLGSLLTSHGQFIATLDVAAWLEERRIAQEFEVTPTPLEEMPGWQFHPHTGNLGHVSGKFFSICGLEGHSDYPEPGNFHQPVISQPEVGILGILAKRFDGILHFLMQAKTEAGNVNGPQLSPTVQATRSNYTQVHGGTRPRYLEYFINRSHGRVLTDQLQSEQGLFFFRKRNRNVIVITEEDVPVHEDFCWLTLGQIKRLLEHDNVVNMDARTVISAIPLISRIDEASEWGLRIWGSPQTYDEAVIASSVLKDGKYTIEEVISWLTEIRATVEVVANLAPLSSVSGWVHQGGEIRREDGGYFAVTGITAESTSREVREWSQPLVKPSSMGVFGFVTQRIRGVLHFLVQARMEPGLWNQIELAPTIQHLSGAVQHENSAGPRYFDLLEELKQSGVRHSSIQSEEGGRFYHYQNRYLVLEAPPETLIDELPHYRWMTLGQINLLMMYGNYLNIEARSLLACLALEGSGRAS